MAGDHLDLNLNEDIVADEQVLHTVGAAVLAQWWRIPKEVQDHIIDGMDRVAGIGLRTPKGAKAKFKRLLKLNDADWRRNA